MMPPIGMFTIAYLFHNERVTTKQNGCGCSESKKKCVCDWFAQLLCCKPADFFFASTVYTCHVCNRPVRSRLSVPESVFAFLAFVYTTSLMTKHTVYGTPETKKLHRTLVYLSLERLPYTYPLRYENCNDRRWASRVHLLFRLVRDAPAAHSSEGIELLILENVAGDSRL